MPSGKEQIEQMTAQAASEKAVTLDSLPKPVIEYFDSLEFDQCIRDLYVHLEGMSEDKKLHGDFYSFEFKKSLNVIFAVEITNLNTAKPGKLRIGVRSPGYNCVHILLEIEKKEGFDFVIKDLHCGPVNKRSTDYVCVGVVKVPHDYGTKYPTLNKMLPSPTPQFRESASNDDVWLCTPETLSFSYPKDPEDKKAKQDTAHSAKPAATAMAAASPASSPVAPLQFSNGSKGSKGSNKAGSEMEKAESAAVEVPAAGAAAKASEAAAAAAAASCTPD